MTPFPRISRRSIAFCALLIIPIMNSTSAAKKNEPAPSSQAKVEKDRDGVTIRHDDTVTRVEVWNDRIIRVMHRPDTIGKPLESLTVVAKPTGVSWTLDENSSEAVIKTAQLDARVEKATGRVRFLNKDGSPILSEAENGTWITADAVGQRISPSLSIGQKFALDPAEGIFGLGQHPENGKMNYVGSVVHLQQRNTIIAVPVLLSSKGYAVLWDNPAVTDIDVGKTAKDKLSWQSEAGTGVDYYFIQGPKPDEAIAGYRWLTGSAPMFGKWAWGFWQSRERYKTQDEILGVVSEYRKRGIPFDGIIQDWQYWPPLNQQTAEGGWGSHEFDPARYPDPAGMMKAVHDQNAHIMVVSWAKFDVTDQKVSIPNLKELEEVKGVYEPAIPYVFPPGRGKWYDPFNDKARKVYWDLLAKQLFPLGVDAWWLDASEAELSGNWGEFRDFKTGKGPGALVYNAYPLEHTRAIYEGQRAMDSDKRVLLLTRSAYAGQQRNAAITWSGDIKSKWDVFQNQIPAGLNFVASGIPYWNTDIGGFFRNRVQDPDFVERFTRWLQFGTFCPMFRVHGTDDPKEVWRFNEATQRIYTDFINLRYHLIPYIYSVSWMVTHDGYTMMRPLVMDFQTDPKALDVSDEFMFGPTLLVCPVTAAGATARRVYLPAGVKWVDFWTGETHDGGKEIEASAPIDKLPIFAKSGSILPYGPKIQYAMEKSDPLELRVYRGANGDFALYEDEGDNYNYEKGSYATIPIHWDDKQGTLTIGARQGEFPGMLKERTFRIVWVKPNQGTGIAPTDKANAEIKYTGQKVEVKATD